MLCYKDRTYCLDAMATCGNTECFRYLTNEIINAADEFELPLSVAAFAEGCDDYKPKTDNQKTN